MKTSVIIGALLASAWLAQAQSTTNFLFNVNQAIPDGNPAGLMVQTNLTGLQGIISSVTVSLDITGGNNGDYYAYLSGPNGGFAVLLNRPGVTNGNPFGYTDSGMNVTFDDSGSHNNIHYYENYVGSIAPTGTWGSDGENVDPLSSLVGSASSTANLLTLDGSDPNGNWTVFLADLSAGGQGNLVNWSLQINTVPEPSAWTLLGLGCAGIGAALGRRAKSK